MSQVSSERRDTAYHEAGHAVAWHHLGRVIEYVTMDEDWFAESLGHTSYRLPDETADPAAHRSVRYLEDRIITAYAGGYAAEKATGVLDEGGCRNDYEQISEYNAQLGGSAEQASERLQRLSRDARALVEAAWPAVEALAAVLLEQDDVSGVRAAEIIQAALPDLARAIPMDAPASPAVP